MKKILFLTPFFPFPPKDGFRQRVFNLIKNLSRDYDITVLSFIDQYEKRFLKDLSLYCEVFTVDKEDNLIKKTKNLSRSLFSKKPYLALASYSKIFENKLKIILKEDFDFVFFEGLQLSQYLNCITHSKTILDLHNPEHIIMRNWYDKETNPAKKSFLRTQLEKMRSYELSEIRKFDKVFTVSKRDSHLMGIADSYNNFIVPNGCIIYDIDFIFKPNLLYVGSLDYKPNEEGLVWFLSKVFPKIKDHFLDITFYIIGRNPSKKIKDFENQNIKVLGYVDDIVPYYNKASLFIVPLLRSGGQRLKILHAMSFKKCVISTKIGAESLDVEDNKNIFFADNSEQFADKVIGLLNNPQIVKDTAENGYELVAKYYDWKEIARNISNLLESR